MTTTNPPHTTADDVREVLLALAEHLAEGPHYRIITEADRLALILAEVTARHGHGPLALTLDREVRLLAPTIGWELTRGEYALTLRAVAGSER